MRAERFDERTDANVATASTSVPAPVTNEEIVAQSVARKGITPHATPGLDPSAVNVRASGRTACSKG
jgi:hypothetical protein